MPRALMPTSGELAEIGGILAKYWPGARKALAPYLNNHTPWDMSLRTIRTVLREAVADVERGRKLPVSTRVQVLTFAGKYGTDTRASVGVAPLTHRKNVRFSNSQMDAIAAAAAKANMEISEFIRNAAVMAAEREAT